MDVTGSSSTHMAWYHRPVPVGPHTGDCAASQPHAPHVSSLHIAEIMSVPFSHRYWRYVFTSGGAPIASSDSSRVSAEKPAEPFGNEVWPAASYRQSRVE